MHTIVAKKLLRMTLDYMASVCDFFCCSLGTRSGVEYPCPAGTFSGQTSTSNKSGCVPCPPGKYCSSAGLAVPTGQCSPGWVAALLKKQHVESYLWFSMYGP